jgi:flavin reductase (DIM6/NTAB) family NADH-FMN oxidoreductase RutF
MTAADTTVSSQGFCELMATFPSGVSVVAAFDAAGRPWGMTCTALCSVTTAPPTLLACLRQGGPTLDAVLGTGAFTVNLLHEGARGTAELFASRDPDRFAKISWHAPANGLGPHLTTAAQATADCRVTEVSPIGDHMVVFGQVVRAGLADNGAPLLYGLRRYGRWSQAVDTD